MLDSCFEYQCSWPGVSCSGSDCGTAALTACSGSGIYEWTLTIYSDNSSQSWYSCCN
jgi:hypothetical protein